MSTKLNYRDASVEESVKIRDLINKAYKDAEKSWRTGLRIEDISEISSKFDKTKGSFYVVDKDNNINSGIIACIFISTPFESDQKYIELQCLAVDPSVQKSGLGRQLLSLAIEKAREQGVQNIQCSVVEHRTELLEWYKRFGFEIISRYPWPKDQEYVLLKPPNTVHFVRMQKVI